MAFRFGLESVLKHRGRLEEIAQREFHEAQAAVDNCLRRIEQMYQRIDEVREEIETAQRVGTGEKLHEIRTMEGFIEGEKIRILRERANARELLRIAEDKQELLILAAREKKVLAKLKDRRQLEYAEKIRVAEAKEIDDLTMTRTVFKRKRV